MCQVLFRLPIFTRWTPDGIPLYGYGVMLFLTFMVCLWLASRLARREKIAPERIQDLALVLFLGGLVGARIVFMIQYDLPLSHFLFIWEGGLVFYGGMLGGALAFVYAFFRLLRPNKIRVLQVADIIAPCAALGLCLGRVGCLLNGCCFGHVACPDCPNVTYPLSGMPRQYLVDLGYQTATGFTLADHSLTVDTLVPHSPAVGSGLRSGDEITEVDGKPINSPNQLWTYLVRDWPRGQNDLTLTVRRANEVLTLPSFAPRTIGLHPTQVYESISTGILFVLLLAYYPFRRHQGELLALFLILYPIHRFLDEMLRDDTKPVAFGMTLSQNGSILVFLIGVGFLTWLWRQPAQYRPWSTILSKSPSVQAT